MEYELDEDKLINEIVQHSKENVNYISGTLKYLYFISPLGYLFSNRSHQLTKELTKKILFA